MAQLPACGRVRPFATGGSAPPFALCLSKRRTELVEAFVPRAKGFDKLSPNGRKAGLRYLGANGSLRTLNDTNEGGTDCHLPAASKAASVSSGRGNALCRDCAVTWRNASLAAMTRLDERSK